MEIWIPHRIEKRVHWEKTMLRLQMIFVSNSEQHVQSLDSI